MSDYLSLNGVVAGESQLTDILEENLIEFFNWGLLNAGMYDDVTIYNLGSATSAYDAPENLYPVVSPTAPSGTVWQAPIRNWVYETGLSTTRQPIAVSGVYVNGTFHPLSATSGAYQHYIDYPNGRVVFTSPIPTSSVVQVNYSYKQIGLYDEDVPWFNTLLFDAFDTNQDTNLLPSGVTGLLKQHQIQLPLVLLESGVRQRQVPRQLGDISQWVYTDFLFHIVAENSIDRNNIVDIVTRQKDKLFKLFDTNARAKNNAYTLDYRGMKITGGLMYPSLISTYELNNCRITDTVVSDVAARIPLFRGIVRVTTETGMV